MKDSKIGWTDHTWNPWMGCNKVSEACKHCYIGGVIRRMGREPFAGPMRTTTVWKEPAKWNREARDKGVRSRVFTCSLSDYFHEDADAWRDEAWDVIKSCENLDWLILTKRPENILDRLPADWDGGYPNAWLGVTIESQQCMDRLDLLSAASAAIRFVSAEPLLGPIEFGRRIKNVDWIITGCEQAAKEKRRVMDPDWVRGIRDQCDAAGIPLFHKQYYQGTQLCYDGRVDGVVRQEWPTTAVAKTLR